MSIVHLEIAQRGQYPKRTQWIVIQIQSEDLMVTEKPLFIPLKTVWFRMFEAGTKTTEFRAYGSRWNEHNCRIGRAVRLSHGYSGARLEMHVVGFKKLLRSESPDAAKEIYPNAEFIAAIELN